MKRWVTVPITAETYAFKVASADWSAVNCGGAADKGPVEVGVPTPLSCGANPSDLSIAIGADGDYTFTLDPTNTGNPLLTVTGP